MCQYTLTYDVRQSYIHCTGLRLRPQILSEAYSLRGHLPKVRLHILRSAKPPNQTVFQYGTLPCDDFIPLFSHVYTAYTICLVGNFQYDNICDNRHIGAYEIGWA